MPQDHWPLESSWNSCCWRAAGTVADGEQLEQLLLEPLEQLPFESGYQTLVLLCVVYAESDHLLDALQGRFVRLLLHVLCSGNPCDA